MTLTAHGGAYILILLFVSRMYSVVGPSIIGHTIEQHTRVGRAGAGVARPGRMYAASPAAVAQPVPERSEGGVDTASPKGK